MPRRFILSTATLAAFLAAGSAWPWPSTRRPENLPGLIATDAAPAPVPTLSVAGLLLAVHTERSAHTTDALDVAIQVAPEADAPRQLRLWAGLKNGWGSPLVVTGPQPAQPGFYLATVPLPTELPAQTRLWIGIEQESARLARGSVAINA